MTKYLNNNIRQTKKCIILLIMLMFSLFSGQNIVAASLLEQADSAYNSKDYRGALSLYNTVLEKNGTSSELQNNIGNSHFRVGNNGRAIVAYERALRLDPSNKDARDNLRFVKSRIKGLPEDGSSFLSNVQDNIISMASPNTWAVLSFTLFLMLLGCASLYLFTSAPRLRKIGFFGGIVVFIFFIYFFIISWQTASAIKDHNTGIIVTQNARIQSSPGTSKDSATKTIAIPEGAKVQILDSLATPDDAATALWYNIDLNNNTEAWIDASDIEKI